MKRTANIMNVKFNTLFYTALFSGLGVFSFLLLINYAAFPDKVADIFHSVGTLSFFVLAFNVLGYATMRLSTWVDNQYALNLHRRWKLISVYVVVMGMFFLLNYGLLVTAKLLAGASHPFMFPNGGWRILITVWLVELVILGLLLANRSIRNALKLQQEAAALQKENNTARYTALQNQLNPHFLFNSLNTLISECGIVHPTSFRRIPLYAPMPKPTADNLTGGVGLFEFLCLSTSGAVGGLYLY